MPMSPATAENIAITKRLLADEKNPEKFERLKVDYELWCWRGACEDPWFFMRHHCKTRNENPDADQDPYQPFPDLEYLRHLLASWQRVAARPYNKIGLTAKSRQMMISWFACAMVLWTCMTRKGSRVGWQSKKAEDADQMLERIYGLWQRLPRSVREKYPCERKFLYLRFPETDCDVHAIPQGPDQVRSYTWSLFISDEMAFQDDADRSYYTLLPALGKNGMAWIISTAGPEQFQLLYEAPMLPQTHEELMAGFKRWETNEGVTITRLHYSADPAKDQGWVERESAKYGGIASTFWRREFEIDFSAMYGGLVFPIFNPSVHCIPPFEIPDEWPKYRVIDPGFRNACACAWFAVDNDGNLILYRELKKTGMKIEQLAQFIKAMSLRETYENTLIDPSAFAKTLAGGGYSVADLFGQHHVGVSPAYRAAKKKDQFFPAHELLVPMENGEPRFKVFNTCLEFVQEMRNYRWKERLADGTEPEEPIKVNDHLIDAWLYICAAINPKRVAERFNPRDPLEPWYGGEERKRVAADKRRMRSALSSRGAEYEP